jgi:phage terminase small subunit
MQLSQSKILRMIKNAPWYVSYQTLHENLNIPHITKVIQERNNKHHDKTKIHSNTILWPLLEEQHRGRLKESWPVDLIDG